MNFQPNTLLVTGGAGFIGSNFVRQQLQRYPQRKIINLDKLTYAGTLDNLKALPKPQQHHFVRGDIADKALVTQLLAQHQIDTIVHFAAESHVDRSLSNPQDFITSNIVGTFTLLEAARIYWSDCFNLDPQRCRFHHVSTDEVYGSLQPTDPAFTEHSPYQPNSPYSASKASADHLARAYSQSYQMPITVSNCSNNYGSYQHTEKLIPKVMSACFNKAPITLYGDGSNIRDWLYVFDHCDAIDRILTESPAGEVYNIGGCHEVSNLDIVHQICELMDHLHPSTQSYKNLIQFVANRAGHDWRYAIDISKIHRTLHWKPQTTFSEGLKSTLNFYHGLRTADCTQSKTFVPMETV